MENIVECQNEWIHEIELIVLSGIKGNVVPVLKGRLDPIGGQICKVRSCELESKMNVSPQSMQFRKLIASEGFFHS